MIIALLFWCLMALFLFVDRRLFRYFCINDIFIIVWFGCAGFANTGLFGLDTPGWKANAMYLFAGVLFHVVYVLFRRLSGEGEYYPDPLESYPEDINFPLLIIANLVAQAVSVYYLPNALTILLRDGFAALRQTAFNNSEWASTQLLLVFQWIIQPIFIATGCITVIAVIGKMRNRLWLLAMTVVDFALYVLLFGGRGILIKFLVFTVFALLWQYNGRILTIFKRHKRIVPIILLIVVLLGYLTTLRSITNFSVLQNAYAYFVGPFIYMERLLEVHPVGELIFFGGATFNFIFGFISAAGKIFFGIDYTAPDNWITTYSATYYQVGENLRMNAMPTMLYPFLCDFGYAGILFGVTFFALFVAAVERLHYAKPSVWHFALFLYIGHITLLSVQNYALFKLDSAMIIIFIYLFTMRVKFRDGVLSLG